MGMESFFLRVSSVQCANMREILSGFQQMIVIDSERFLYKKIILIDLGELSSLGRFFVVGTFSDFKTSVDAIYELIMTISMHCRIEVYHPLDKKIFPMPLGDLQHFWEDILQLYRPKYDEYLRVFGKDIFESNELNFYKRYQYKCFFRLWVRVKSLFLGK